MIEPSELVLSASSIGSYLRCSYAYYLGNVLRIPSPPNMDMLAGTGVHSAAEAFHKGENPEEALAAAMAEGLASMPGVIPAEAAGAVSNALAMYGVYRDKIAPTFVPIMVEQGFVIRVDGVLASGQIDVTDDQDQVRDTKTTRLLSKFRPDRHRLQLSLYGIAFRALTGRKPRRLLLDVVAKNLRFKTVEIEPDEGEFVDVLTLVAGGIMRSEFEPTGAWSGACNRCPYSTGVCTYARLD